MAAGMLKIKAVELFLECCVNQIAYHCFGESNPNHVLNFGLPVEQDATDATKATKATIFDLIRSRTKEDPIIHGYLLGLINMSISNSVATREYIYSKRSDKAFARRLLQLEAYKVKHGNCKVEHKLDESLYHWARKVNACRNAIDAGEENVTN